MPGNSLRSAPLALLGKPLFEVAGRSSTAPPVAILSSGPIMIGPLPALAAIGAAGLAPGGVVGEPPESNRAGCFARSQPPVMLSGPFFGLS